MGIDSDKLLLLVLGVFLGLIPSAIQVRLQGREQRRQLLFDRRLGALKDFSTAISNKDQEAEQVIAEMQHSSKPEEDIPQLESIMTERRLARSQYVASLHAEALAMSSVFGVPFRVVNYENLEDFKAELKAGENIKQRRKDIKESSQQLADLIRQEHKEMLKFIESYEGALESLGKILNE